MQIAKIYDTTTIRKEPLLPDGRPRNPEHQDRHLHLVWTDMPAHYDVAIVGAGASGLAAAQELSGTGLRVAIVEARERIGGRIYTLHAPDFLYPIEMGAEFIHGMPSHTWELIESSGLTAYEVPEAHWFFELGSRRTTAKKVRNFWKKLSRIFSGIDSEAVNDTSFQEYLKKSLRLKLSRLDRELALAFVEGFNAADPSRISVKSLLGYDNVTEALDISRIFRVAQGYDGLLRVLWNQTAAPACSVLLNNPIREIRWGYGSVELLPALQGGNQRGVRLDTVVADQAIITLPIGVLAIPRGEQNSVSFSPELPKKADAVSWMDMGPVVKVVLRFNHVLWEELGLSRFNFIHTSPENSAFPSWWNTAPVQMPILTGWAGGPAAHAMRGRTEEEVRELAIHSLSRLFSVSKATLKRGIESFYFYDWQSDPFSRGAYSYVTVGGHSARSELAQPLEDTLFFAGEATLEAGLSGTVDGAITTGKRAAREVVAARHRLRKSAA